MKITIKGLDGTILLLEVEPNTTVAQLIHQVSAKSDHPAEYIRLVWAGMAIERQPTKTMESLEICDNSIIHFVKKSPPQKNSIQMTFEMELEKRDKIINDLQYEILWLRAELESRNN